MSTAISERDRDPKEDKEASRPVSARKRFSSFSAPQTPNGAATPLKTPAHSIRSPNESFHDSGVDDRHDHRRGLSNSSAEQENSMEGNNENERKTHTRKRGSTDMVDYPRRRAVIACEICRGRKSRCDGAKPRCKLCTELNAECIYREPGVKLDAGDKLILERLNRIEGLLQSNMMGSAKGHHIPSQSPTNSNATTVSREDMMSSTLDGHETTQLTPVAGLGSWTSSPTNISTMPKIHTTPALHLLMWPQIRLLVSRPYDPQHLLQLELSREPLRLGTSLSLDLANTAAYVEAFFERVNVWYACVNPYSWASCYQVALSHGFREGPESCIALLVLALGCASLGGSISRVPAGKDPPGMPYFAAAWGLIPGLMTRNTTLSSQCLILASAYLFYLVRPLEAWTLLSSTSMKLQLLLSGQGRIPNHSKELCERVYWNALLFESDLLAELDLPSSGIGQFEEAIGLPGGFMEEEDDPPGRDELWYFLAEIALRRILNRVSHMIYSKGAKTTLAALEPLVAELDYQLTQWYQGLPKGLQFPKSRTPLDDPVQTVLRLRYYACRTIIFRPYVQAVLENEQIMMDTTVRENCQKCLEACVRQLDPITAHHAGHLPYLWQGALSIVSQTLLIMGSSLVPSLSALLQPAKKVDAMINDVLLEVEQYAHLAPSLRLSSEIIREAEKRRQLMLRPNGPIT